MFNKSQEKWIDVRDKNNNIIFNDNKIIFNMYGRKDKTSIKTAKRFAKDDEYIIFNNDFERLIKSTIKFNGEDIEVLSGGITEFDSGDFIIFNKFVKEEDYDKVVNKTYVNKMIEVFMFNKKDKYIDIKDKKNTIIMGNSKVTINVNGVSETAKIKEVRKHENDSEIFIYSNVFESIITSSEEINGEKINILSGIIMEFDGRGPIVVNEFVKEKDYKKIPKGFRSKVCIEHNDVEPVMTYMEQ